MRQRCTVTQNIFMDNPNLDPFPPPVSPLLPDKKTQLPRFFVARAGGNVRRALDCTLPVAGGPGIAEKEFPRHLHLFFF